MLLFRITGLMKQMFEELTQNIVRNCSSHFEQLKKFIFLQLQLEHNLPSEICVECSDKLDSFYFYR